MLLVTSLKHIRDMADKILNFPNLGLHHYNLPREAKVLYQKVNSEFMALGAKRK